MTSRTWGKAGAATMSALVLVLVSCGDDPTGGDDLIVEQDALTFVRLAADAAPVVRDTGFWAVRGENRELEIDIPAPDGGTREFLEFQVDAGSLLQRPDGTVFQEGDSVFISVSIAPDSVLVRFEPSGLRFDPARPAQLEIDYGAADPDLDDDGDIDADDDDFESRLAIWKQERPGDPWLRLGTVQFEDLDEVEADIIGFTGFALAGH